MNWKPIKTYQDIKFDLLDVIARISINRPEKHNAFTPLTVAEMIEGEVECPQCKRDKLATQLTIAVPNCGIGGL